MRRACKEELGATPGDTLAGFKSVLDRTTSPPGPIDAMVAEVVIHGEDIRRPSGSRTPTSPRRSRSSATSSSSGNLLLGGKRRATGLTLTATDVDWTRGSGPEVKGPLASIILALTGRKAGLGRPDRRRIGDVERADVAGPGVASV